MVIYLCITRNCKYDKNVIQGDVKRVCRHIILREAYRKFNSCVGGCQEMWNELILFVLSETSFNVLHVLDNFVSDATTRIIVSCSTLQQIVTVSLLKVVLACIVTQKMKVIDFFGVSEDKVVFDFIEVLNKNDFLFSGIWLTIYLLCNLFREGCRAGGWRWGRWCRDPPQKFQMCPFLKLKFSKTIKKIAWSGSERLTIFS